MSEKLEKERSPEFIIKPTDVVVVTGRGVERWVDSDGEEHWKPTGYIQEAKIEGKFEDGEPRKVRTANWNPDIDPDDPETWVGGGTANTIAGIEAMEELTAQNAAPKFFIVSAGRPGYLKNTPEGFSEGVVMEKILRRRIGDDQEMLIQGEGKQTKDDVVKSLENALARGAKSVTFINTEIAMPRMRAHYEDECDKNPEFKTLDVNFVTAEDVLRHRYRNNPNALRRFEAIQERLKNSEAYKFVAKQEKIGIEEIKKQQYDRKGDY